MLENSLKLYPTGISRRSFSLSERRLPMIQSEQMKIPSITIKAIAKDRVLSSVYNDKGKVDLSVVMNSQKIKESSFGIFGLRRSNHSPGTHP